MRVYLSQADDMLESKLFNAPGSVNLKSLFPRPGTEATLQKCPFFVGLILSLWPRRFISQLTFAHSVNLAITVLR